MTSHHRAPGADDPEDATLAEVIHRLLDRGVVVRGELWLTVADVELVYVGAQLVLASPEAIRKSWSEDRTAQAQ